MEINYGPFVCGWLISTQSNTYTPCSAVRLSYLSSQYVPSSWNSFCNCFVKMSLLMEFIYYSWCRLLLLWLHSTFCLSQVDISLTGQMHLPYCLPSRDESIYSSINTFKLAYIIIRHTFTALFLSARRRLLGVLLGLSLLHYGNLTLKCVFNEDLGHDGKFSHSDSCRTLQCQTLPCQNA